MKLCSKIGLMLFALRLGMDAVSAEQLRTVQVRTANGVVEGVVSPDGRNRLVGWVGCSASPMLGRPSPWAIR